METNYFWDSVTGTCLAELDENGDVTVQYTTNPQTGELISENHTGEEVYHLYDGDGNTRQTADSAGNLLGEAAYTAFGETVAESGDMKTTYRFRGRQGFSTDPVTGDVSRANQNYLPSLGRHLSPISPYSGSGLRNNSCAYPIRVAHNRQKPFETQPPRTIFVAAQISDSSPPIPEPLLPTGVDWCKRVGLMSCSDYVATLIRNQREYPILTVRNALSCGLSVFCGRCGGGGFEGRAFPVALVPRKKAAVCLGHDLMGDQRDWDAIMLHESVHIGQFMPIPCNPPQRSVIKRHSIPRDDVGGSSCNQCKIDEGQAYSAQAAFLFPNDLVKQVQWATAGVCISCAAVCGFKNCPSLPEVNDFPLE